MNFGDVRHIKVEGDTEIEHSSKYFSGQVTVDEEIHKERVQIIRPSDLDDIVRQMHIDHALDSTYGAWVEKTNTNKLYAVKYWVVRRM